MISDRYLRPVAISFAAIALVLAVRMVECLGLSITSVLVRDQWLMLDEIVRLHQHQLTLAYVWIPYWGHRIVIPRLIFLFDERLFHSSNTPLVFINVVAQGLVCATLIAISQRALGACSRWMRILVAVVIVNLCFSSLQMENFVYGMAIQYTLGCLFAIAALVLNGYSENSRRQFTLAIFAALLATLTSAAGMIVWPVMIVEALWLKASRVRLALLAVILAASAIAYSIGFVNVGTGMGLTGFMRHPLTGIQIASMVLGGPLSVFKLWVGQLAGLFGLVVAACLSVSLFRKEVNRDRVILAAIFCFFTAVAFSFPIGRYTPAFIASFKGPPPLSSRYFTFSFLFWASLLPAVLTTPSAGSLSRISRAVVAFIIAGLTLGTAVWQFQEPLDWVAFTRQLEAVSSSFFVGADDPERTAIIVTDQAGIDRWVPYLREHRLSVYNEPRATWVGQPISALLDPNRAETCPASHDFPAPNGRLTGTIPNSFVAKYGGTDILFSGPNNRIIGIGRTAFDSHQPFPPASYPFLGYIQIPAPASITVWSLGDRICRF